MKNAGQSFEPGNFVEPLPVKGGIPDEDLMLKPS